MLLLVSYAAIICVIMQRSSPEGGTLHDDANNGSIGDCFFLYSLPCNEHNDCELCAHGGLEITRNSNLDLCTTVYIVLKLT